MEVWTSKATSDQDIRFTLNDNNIFISPDGGNNDISYIIIDPSDIRGINKNE